MSIYNSHLAFILFMTLSQYIKRPIEDIFLVIVDVYELEHNFWVLLK